MLTDTSPVRCRIGNVPVSLAPFVPFGEMLGDGHPFFIHKQHAMTVFIAFHVVTGAKPLAFNHSFFLVRVEPTGT